MLYYMKSWNQLMIQTLCFHVKKKKVAEKYCKNNALLIHSYQVVSLKATCDKKDYHEVTGILKFSSST